MHSSLMGEVGFEPTSYKSQGLASPHNNHSVTRLLLIGIEPISSHSQYDILAY
jgi:hypothetical protein